MSVVSVKVPEEVKKDMKEFKGKVNWSEEIRRFISKKIEENRRIENIEKADRLLRKSRKLPQGTAANLIREDRDSHN
jgi:hypothetical protein